jgi:hypothetical protein
VDPRASLDDLEKRKFLTLLGLELRPLSHPAHSQSLHRLRHPASCKVCVQRKPIVLICCISVLLICKLVLKCFQLRSTHRLVLADHWNIGKSWECFIWHSLMKSSFDFTTQARIWNPISCMLWQYLNGLVPDVSQSIFHYYTF